MDATVTPTPSLVCEESGSGPALLCLHGVGGTGAWFTGLARRLSDRYRVIALDLPGTGRNRAGHAPFSVGRSAETLAGWLAEREIGPVSLLGHSMGTMIGLRLAARIPLKALLCVGGLPAVTPANHARLSQRADLIRREGMGGLGWRVAEGNFSPETLARHPEIAALFGRLWECQPAETYLEGLDSLLAENSGAYISGASLPALVLRGVADGYAPAAESRRFADSLPGLRRFVELEGCAHMPFLEDPEAFAAAVAEFLETYA